MALDEIKAQFLHEYVKSSNLEAIQHELAAGFRGPVGPPPDFRVHMLAALEAVAAQLWDDGYQAAVYNNDEVCNCNAWNWGECACGNYANPNQNKTNPYKETT